MNIAALFIRRPVMTTLVMGAVLVFGIFGYRLLPVNDLPNVDFPTIQVSASLQGASPETMASTVAAPLERQFSTIAGISAMSSSNSLGRTQITLQFNLNRDIDAAAQDVQAAIAQAARQLPSSMETPPSYRKVNPADQPVLFLSMDSTLVPLSTIDEYAETVVGQRISMISGVAQVLIFGAQKYAVRVQLNPMALATRDIGIDEVLSAIQSANANLPTGILSGASRTYTITMAGRLERAADFRPLIVAYRNGKPVRLDELGSVLDSVENTKVAGWHNLNRSIGVAVQRQPGTNTVQVVDSILKVLPALRAQVPASINLEVMYDRSRSIRESINDVQFTLLLAIGLVILVIFIFLRNLSATVIPSLALPMSIVGTFAVMYALGFSRNNLSMMALILAVGFVVDDAIVMLENIFRHMEKGEPGYKASLDGSKEISFTIISMTLSLVAVFIPVIFMGGILGRILHEFAVTIGVSILVSGAVSLSLTPMLSSRFLRPPRERGTRAFLNASERFFDGMRNGYERSLSFILRNRPLAMVVFCLILAATLLLFMKIPKGFLPSEDTGRLSGSTEAQQGISFDEMVKHQQEVASIVAEDPNIQAFNSSVGGGGGFAGTNTGSMFIALKPRPPRSASPDEVIQGLRRKVSRIPGIRTYFQNPPSLPIGGISSRSQYQYTLQDPDTDELYRYADILLAKLRESPALFDVTSDLQLKNPQVSIDIDKDRAAALGVSILGIQSALSTAYGSNEVSTIYGQNNQYSVVMELEPEYQSDPSALSMLYIRSSSGQLVPLDAVARLSQTAGPLSVNHLGQFPAVTISFNLARGVALGDAVSIVSKTSRATLPASINASFQGTAQAFQASFQNMLLLLIIAIFVIYVVLGILYESFIHPITILSGLPAAGFGALLTLLIFKQDLSLYAFVGVFMLVGIVKKNAIMMIDFALAAERKEGKNARDAIYEGCVIRFRPIIMTTMCALFGTLPIAIGFGAGAEARRPLGLAVVGGLLFSQLLTLYFTPVIYLYLDSFQKRLRKARLFNVRGETAAEQTARE